MQLETKKGKTAKKQKPKKARKTRRRKVAGAGFGTAFYRAAHKFARGTKSNGEQSEIDDAKEKRDRDELEKLRKNPDYTPVDLVDDFEKGTTYVQFKGADADPMIKNLGQFERIAEDFNRYGATDTFIFEHGKIGPYIKNSGDDSFIDASMTTPRGISTVFKVNSGAIIGEDTRLPKDIANEIGKYGGRKRKTRKTKKGRK